MLEKTTRLRDHLHAPVADQPGQRPDTRDLIAWTERLAELVRAYGVTDTGVDWGEPGEARTAPRRETTAASARVAAAPARQATRVQDHVGPAEHAPVNLRRDESSPIRGRASVPPPRPPRTDTGVMSIDPTHPPEPPPQPWHQTSEDPRTLKLGWEYSGIGAAFAFVCWGIWAASNRGDLTAPVIAFVVVLAVAGGLFALSRLIGRLVLVQRMGRVRRTARGAHAVAGVFLALAGVAYLRQTPWIVEFLTWLRDLI
jgi:hypothetical protein